MPGPRTLRFVALIAIVFGAACSNGADNTPDTAPPVRSVTLTSGHAQTVGTVLANGTGLVLYGNASEKPVLNCDATCATTWPLLTVVSRAAIHLPKPTNVQPALIGTVKGPGGNLVVTYGGYPLHTYSGDTAATAGNGQGIAGYDAVNLEGQLTKPPAP